MTVRDMAAEAPMLVFGPYSNLRAQPPCAGTGMPTAMREP